MKKYFRGLKHKLLIGGALALLIVNGLFPVLFAQIAHATSPGILEPRSIQMSSSVAGATAQYTISFKTITTGYPLEVIIIDFCDSSPLNGANCAYTSGQSINLSSVSWTGGSIAGVTDTNTAHWIISNTSPLLTLTDTNAAETGTNQPSQTVTIILTGFANPNYTPTCLGTGTPPNCTFYARILTYAGTSGGYSCGVSSCSIGTAEPGGQLLDDGGIALSTNQAITVTSKVQEQLIFCVYTNATCALGGNSVPLGDTNDILYTSGPFVDRSTKYSVTTNAINNVVIRLLGTNLQGPAGTITAMGASPTPDTYGSNQFGMCSWSSGTVTITQTYTDCTNADVTQTANTGATGGDFGDLTTWAFDASNTTGTTSTYGWQIATVSPGTGTATVAFVGDVSASQQAGVFTTTLTFVATGSY
jgi:hypothetical protein